MEPYKTKTDDIINETVNTMMSIYDEIDGAKSYIRDAFKMRGVDKSISETRALMSSQEMQHAKTLTANVNKMLEKMRAENSPCYDVLNRVWEHIHERQAEYMSHVEHMHAEYKNDQY